MHLFMFTARTDTGHVNPVLSATRTLVKRGHHAVGIRGRADGAKLDSNGVRLQLLPETFDTILGWTITHLEVTARSPSE